MALIAELGSLSDLIAVDSTTTADIEFAAPKKFGALRSVRSADTNSETNHHDRILQIPWIDPNSPTSETELFVRFLRDLIAHKQEEPFPQSGFMIITKSGPYSTIFTANSTPRLWLNLEHFSRPGSFLQRQLSLADANYHDSELDSDNKINLKEEPYLRLLNLNRYLFTDRKLSDPTEIYLQMYDLFGFGSIISTN